MKNKFIFIITIVIMFLSFNVASASNKPAAPYTNQASYKIGELVDYYGSPVEPLIKDPQPADYMENLIIYFNDIYDEAGYDFKKSVEKYVVDRENNPDAFLKSPLHEYAFVLILLIDIKFAGLYQGDKEALMLKKYFSQNVVNYVESNAQKLINEKEERCIEAPELTGKFGQYILDGMPLSYVIADHKGDIIIDVVTYPG